MGRLIPDMDIIYTDEKGVVEMPSLTYAIELEKEDESLFSEGRITGKCDGLAAVRQAVYKILRTEKDKFIIYGEYGSEHFGLTGKPYTYAVPELERTVSEALLRDSRIRAVDDFSFEREGEKVSVSFTVHSIFGDFGEVIENV